MFLRFLVTFAFFEVWWKTASHDVVPPTLDLVMTAFSISKILFEFFFVFGNCFVRHHVDNHLLDVRHISTMILLKLQHFFLRPNILMFVEFCDESCLFSS